MRRITGLQGFRLCAAYSTNEHDLYLPALCLMNHYGCVSQLHMKGTFHNAALMRVFGIKPIILVRRIEDIIVSLQHDLKRKAERPTIGTGQEGYSFVWQDRCTKGLSDQRLLDMIIDLAVPWFVNFYVSWYRLCEQRAVDALWVTYEQLFAKRRKHFGRCWNSSASQTSRKSIRKYCRASTRLSGMAASGRVPRP
ncbi:MAG: hypothetical protein M3R31_06625 [Pseudomonadota bacterium]|nr:hypothetical protein [Pseudomonadota bacterium]